IAAAPGASLSIVAPTADASPGGKGISGVTTFTFAAGAFSDPDAIYTWDFGDGSPAGNGLTATHTYTREGTFTATVHVSGAKTGTARTTVRVGSLTGSWIQTNAGSIFMRLVIAQQGASLSGTWYVMVPAGTPFSPVNNAAFSATALTGSVRSPNLVAMTQGGECQRVITQGSVDPELTVISGPATALNTACTNIGTQTFARDTAPPITSVVVSGGATSLLAGASTTFTATVTGGFNKQVIWTTSNPSVAGVNATGTVTANGTGTATITAIAIGDPTKTATAQVSVGSPKVVRSVIVTPSSTSIQVGGTTAFSAVVDADTGVDRSVKWSSSNAGVATVSGTGVVTGVAAGTATITATSVADASKSGSGTVTVIAAAVKSIVIKQGPDIPLGMKVSGDVTKNLTATLVFDPGADTTLVWSTANSSIATVTSTGALTGRGFGTTTVTAQSASTPTVSATSSVFVCGFPTIVSINNAVTGIPTNLGAVRDSIDVVIGGAAVTQPGVRSANVTIQAAAGSPLTQSPFIAAGSTSQVTSRINTRTLPNGTYLLSASIWDFVPGSSAVATAGCASTPVNITINNP
ncbi:MAG TPA: Ig-like domain-containing protein, partial [Gemmatimonadaceae bacterium]|nr:Ig-like domain-containing protein [Gemmatimonadaceae bacterium]